MKMVGHNLRSPVPTMVVQFHLARIAELALQPQLVLGGKMMKVTSEALFPTYSASSRSASCSKTNSTSIIDYCSPEMMKTYITTCLIRFAMVHIAK
jgi:hypothetical protein